MSAVRQQAKVREYLRTHEVDATGCPVCDGVVGVDADVVREALQ